MGERARGEDRGAGEGDRETQGEDFITALYNKAKRMLLEKASDPFELIAYAIIFDAMRSASKVDRNIACKPMLESYRSIVKKMVSDIVKCENIQCVRKIINEYEELVT